jgi:hypothetical protein
LFKRILSGFTLVVTVLLGAMVLSAQESTMTMPADVYATAQAVVEKYPHTGTDEERRVAMEKVVATIRARHGLRWVWKTEHQSLIAPSKDGLGYVPEGEVVHGRLTKMFIWDTISGGTRKLNPAPMNSEAARPAYVLAVEPKDWLAGAVPPPPTVENLQAQVRELTEKVAAIPVLQGKVDELTSERNELLRALDAAKKELADLKAKPAPTCRAALNLGAFRIPIPCTIQ